jgi:glycosyltransferase involved in cell wall biosynthesis
MRLLCVIENLGSGGGQRQLVNLAIALSRRGHDVRFFVYHPHNFFAETLRHAGIDVRRSSKSFRWSLQPMVDLRREFRTGAYDVVLSFLTSPNAYSELAHIGSRRPKLVVSERSINAHGHGSLAVSLRLQLHRLADYITTNSHHQCAQLKRLCPWAAERVATIWNGVDLIRFRPPKRRVVGGALKLLVVSRVEPWKNGLRLIEALDILRSAYGLRPVVTWVGEQGNSTHHASEEMRRQIDQRGLTKQWRWQTPTLEVPTLMQQHDTLVHPSYLEGLPNAICEALATGLPVLASNVLDHPLLVQHGRSGLLFDPFDSASLAKAIHRFHTMSDSERGHMGQAARAFAESRLSMERYVAESEAILARVLG